MDLLLNWLLHGTALTLLVALGVRVCGGMNAATRELVWWITVIAVTLMPAGYILTDFARASRPAALFPMRGRFRS